MAIALCRIITCATKEETMTTHLLSPREYGQWCWHVTVRIYGSPGRFAVNTQEGTRIATGTLRDLRTAAIASGIDALPPLREDMTPPTDDECREAGW